MTVNHFAELTIQVPFYDLDPMSIVWHGNYVKYFEKVRCKLLSQINYDYCEMRDSGYIWPIIDMRLKYINSATFGQELRCVATLSEYENRLKINYEIFCKKTQKRMTKGYTIQVAVNIKSQEMQLVSPDVLLRKLGVKNEQG